MKGWSFETYQAVEHGAVCIFASTQEEYHAEYTRFV